MLLSTSLYTLFSSPPYCCSLRGSLLGSCSLGRILSGTNTSYIPSVLDGHRNTIMTLKSARIASEPSHSAGLFASRSLDGPEIGTLVVVVDRAKNLPNLRTMGKQDPYCAARLGKTAKKTETDRRGGQTPRWFVLPVVDSRRKSNVCLHTIGIKSFDSPSTNHWTTRS